MSRYPRQHIDELRQLPLPQVAKALGYQRSHADPSKWKTNDSILSINGTQFYDHLQLKGGGGAIDLTLHAQRQGFERALSFLQSLSPASDDCQSKWLHVHRYLCHQRGLNPKLIDRCHNQHIIQADQRTNAVFIMRNASTQPTGAELVGTHEKHRFRGLKKNSRRQTGGFWFTTKNVDIKDCRTALLTESAIDALSVACLNLADEQTVIVSTAGVLFCLPKWLENLNLERIVCGYDADSPGDFAASKLAADPRIVRHRPNSTKDWNELLQKQTGKLKP